MTIDDVMAAAFEANRATGLFVSATSPDWVKALAAAKKGEAGLRFAVAAYGAACAAAEREECAKLCESGEVYVGTDSWLIGHATACREKASAIRVRGTA